MDQRRTEEPQVKVVDRRWWARTEGTEQPAEEPGTRKPTVVEDLEQQLADARNRIQELMTGHRQSVDEFDQVRSRLRRDITREVERGRRLVIVEFLEVLDNLDRALAAVTQVDEPPTDPLARGVSLVRDQFLAKLEGFGVVRLPALGEPFDATQHEAVTTTPVPDASLHGLVVAVVKEGYAIGDEVLRPAAVVVGQHE